VHYFGGLLLLVTLLGVTALASKEFYGLARSAGYHPSDTIGIIVALALNIQAYLRLDCAWGVIAVGIVATPLWGYLFRDMSKTFLADWACTLGGVLYSGGLLYHAILLRSLPNGFAWGMIAILGTWTYDTSAYFIGRKWGRYKFVPRISPNKTWEGAIGGFLCSLIIVCLTSFVFKVPMVHSLVLGMLVPLAVTAGDLTESMLKRSAGVKDAGTLIPGHGGLLDRIDGLMFAIVTVYYYATRIAGA
jgi:phosphatidate cytidylyltransferase